MGYAYPEIKDFNGLYLQKNSFTVPDGALEVANNVFIQKDGIITKRRGFYQYYDPVADVLNNVTLYDTKLIAVLEDDIRVFSNTGTAPNETGSATAFTKVSGLSISVGGTGHSGRVSRFAQSNKNLYFTTDDGVYKIESSTTADTKVQKAGVPPGLDLSATTAVATGGVFQGNSQVNYRVIFGKRDANDNLLLGSPSDFLALTNAANENASWTASGTTVTVAASGHSVAVNDSVRIQNSGDPNIPDGTYTVTAITAGVDFDFVVSSAPGASGTLTWSQDETVTLEFSIPSEIPSGEGYFYQVYRTERSASGNDEAGNTYKFVEEKELTGGEITAGFATYVDNINEILLGAELYTNANSREGELQANDRPPLCDDIAFYKNHLIYAKATTRHLINLDVIDVDALTAGDTLEVTVGATTRSYVANTDFTISVSSSVSVALRETAQSIVEAINRDSSSLVYARYISAPVDDVPGRMRFQAKGFGDPIELSVALNGGDAFSPELTTTSTDNQSENEDRPNAIYVSKLQEPEAVPILNFLQIGAANAAILAVRALRDSLIVLKEDGVYRVTGDTFSSFTATPLDTTVVCRAPSSVKVLNNQVIFLSNQGVCLVTESSVQIISRVIEDVIQPILTKTELEANTSAVAYESERLYLLSTLGLNETTNTVVYAYNILNDTWTTWDTLFKQGAVGPNDTLYLINSGGDLDIERKKQTLIDYCGQNHSSTVTAVASDKLSATVTVSAVIPLPGDVLVKDNVFSRITSVTGSGPSYTLTFQKTTNLAASDTPDYYRKYDSNWTLAPFHAGAVGRMKQFAQMQMHFKNSEPSRLEIAFQSYSFGGSAEVDWENQLSFEGWGLFPWGFAPWGQEDGINLSQFTDSAGVCRVYVPRFAQRTTYIKPVVQHSIAGEQINLQAVAFAVRPYKERVSR